MKRFISIMQFMTRIPLPIDVGIDEAFYKATIYFPYVGLVLGLFNFLIGKVAGWYFDPYISATLILIGQVILTGGLHLDGVGDTFDGLYSYRSKERILEIMKDSRLGTNALLAIVLLLLLKLGLIYHLVVTERLYILILMPAFGRMMQVIACYKTKTPRSQGMGNMFIGKVSTKRLIGTTLNLLIIVTVILALFQKLALGYMGYQLLTLLGLSIGLRGYIKYVYTKIDGVTGDILGCICEMSELIYLIVMYNV